MPAPISEDIVKAVKNLWASHTDWTGKEVWKEYKRMKGGRQFIGLRKVQEIIAEVKRDSPHDRFPFADWEPWQNDLETAEDADYLLQLGEVSFRIYGRRLYQHEARWAQRLRVALSGLSMAAQCLLVLAYGDRDARAYELNQQSSYTGDLDSILATKPWAFPLGREDPSLEVARAGHDHYYTDFPEEFIWLWLGNQEVNLPRIQEILGLSQDWQPESLLWFDSKSNAEGAVTPREVFEESRRKGRR